MAKEGKKGKERRMARLLELFAVSAKLGLTSFGGPTAHLAYFYDEYVRRKKWIDDRSFADLTALCHFLPGPASSQVGIGIGIIRAGLPGGLASWLGFTLPSAAALIAFALFVRHGGIGDAGWIHGLKVVAVAVVAHALFGMGRNLADGPVRSAIAVAAAVLALLWPSSLGQMLIIAAAGLAGRLFLRGGDDSGKTPAGMAIRIGRKTGAACLALFFALLVILPLFRPFADSVGYAMFDSFYRSGALVFGGGHIVLPLLEREAVPAGWIGPGQFLAGYGVAQAVPGPLFTFAAYIGAAAAGIGGGILTTVAIFLPGFLLVAGTLPFWDALRRNPLAQSMLGGVNSAVVGLLLAALYDPLWLTTIGSSADFALALVLFAMLAFWKLPSWVVVLAGALAGAAMPVTI